MNVPSLTAVLERKTPDGLKSYYLPLGGGGYWKSFRSPLDSFWCCTGTGVEEYAKFGDTIYFHDEHGLFVNLFIASELNWPEKGVRWVQETNFPEDGKTRLVVHTEKPVEMDLNIRIPYWVTRGAKDQFERRSLPESCEPGQLSDAWHEPGRMATLWKSAYPWGCTWKRWPATRLSQAVMYGPLVLAGRLGSENLTQSEIQLRLRPTPVGNAAPVSAINSSSRDPLAWVEATPTQPASFRVTAGSRQISLIPFYKLLGEKYVVYWKV